MSELQHLSYSSVSLYQLCARAWQFRYIDQVPTPSSPALAFGKAFHLAIERACVAGTTGEPSYGGSLAGIWEQAWTETLEQGPIRWDGELPEQVLNEGLRLLNSPPVLELLRTLAPLVEDGKPVIEKRIELRVPGVPIPLIGFIDMIGSDGIPVDFKTSSRAWTAEKAADETQPLFYHAALNQLGYLGNRGYRFKHIVFVKGARPQVQQFETKHSAAQLFWLFEAISEVWRAIQASVFVPNPTSWKCNPKYCEYYSRCRGRP